MEIEVVRSPCRKAWWVCLNGECFHTEPTRKEAVEVAERLSRRGYAVYKS
jgi:hypothetical protein